MIWIYFPSAIIWGIRIRKYFCDSSPGAKIITEWNLKIDQNGKLNTVDHNFESEVFRVKLISDSVSPYLSTPLMSY